MIQLSVHFSLEEATASSTATRLSIPNLPSEGQRLNMIEAAHYLEQIRDMLGAPIYVDSWLRVPALNTAIGGAAKSAHMDGWAIDFTCPAFGTPQEVVRRIQDSGLAFDQCIQEGTWVHISFAPEMRQQVLTARFTAGKPTTYSMGV